MTSRVNILEAWQRHEDFEFGDLEEEAYCDAAAAFSEWAQDMLARLGEQASAIAINQAKVLLLDRYWAWYATVAVRHRNHIGQRGNHTCIFQVFDNAYGRLRGLELSVRPPMLAEPKANKPPVAHLPALILGELGEEDYD